MEITQLNSYSKLYQRRQHFKQHSHQPPSAIDNYTEQVSQKRKKVQFKSLDNFSPLNKFKEMEIISANEMENLLESESEGWS